MNRLKNFVKDLLCAFRCGFPLKGLHIHVNTQKYNTDMYIIILNSAIWLNECVNKITFLLSFTRSILLTKMQKFWNKKRLHVPSKWLYSLIMIISEDCVYWLSCWLVFHSYYCSDFKLSNSSTEKNPKNTISKWK